MREIVSPLSGIRSPFGPQTSALAFYAANGLRPTFVLDPSRQKYFVDGLSTNLAGAVTHSRASGATYLDSNGVLQTAASGEIRDQAYAYVDGVLTGPYLLTEPDGANLFASSTGLFTGSPSLVTATLSQANSLTGLSDASLWDDGTSIGYHRITEQATGVVGGTTYTISVFARNVDRQYIGLVAHAGIGTYAGGVFDISNGTVKETAASIWAVVGGDIEDFGGGWYRCSLSFTPSSSVTAFPAVMMSDGSAIGGFGTAPYAGSNKTLYAFGLQLEPASGPSSYIPTSGSQGARAEDVLTIPNPPWPSGDPGSRAIGISMKGLMTGENSTFFDWTLDANNGIQITSGASDFTFTQEAASVVDSVTGGSYASGINVPFSIASRHGDNFINGAVGGTALTANLTPTILPDLSATPIAIRASGGPLYLEEMRIWIESAVDKITDALIEEASE